MTTDGAILLGYAAENPDELKVVVEPFSEERYGVGYSKDHPEMCQWINDTIEASYEDGTWEEAFARPPSARPASTPRSSPSSTPARPEPADERWQRVPPGATHGQTVIRRASDLTYLKAFWLTTPALRLSGLASLVFGTLLGALRVGPVAVHAAGGGHLRHRWSATRRC